MLVIGLLFPVAFFAFSSLVQQGLPSANPSQAAVDLQSENILASTEPLPFEDPDMLFPTPTCRVGLMQFDAGLSQPARLSDLQSIRTAIQQAITSNDLQLEQYLKARLAELIGTDANTALAVLDAAETAQELELSICLQAVRDSAAVHNPQVVERLLTMAEQHTDPQHQYLALASLRTQSALTAAQLDRLAVLGKERTKVVVARAATGVIGHVMRNDFARFEEYVGRFIAESQVHEEVVYYAVELSGVYTQTPFGDVSRQRLARIVLHHPSKDVRREAALVISTAQDREAVLKVFQQAFREDNDFCLRWALVKFSVRAAGAKALPLLEEFATLDPRFQQDYLDFKSLYDAGIVDWEHIWLAKNEKSPHPCDAAP
ncbi:MAG: HEAT repeat domain-containing protein [Candidatus Binatia bacterium]|nr:HEAT repeat domain-containing protein [Candidatus Binatia bacterium]